MGSPEAESLAWIRPGLKPALSIVRPATRSPDSAAGNDQQGRSGSLLAWLKQDGLQPPRVGWVALVGCVLVHLRRWAQPGPSCMAGEGAHGAAPSPGPAFIERLLCDQYLRPLSAQIPQPFQDLLGEDRGCLNLPP